MDKLVKATHTRWAEGFSFERERVQLDDFLAELTEWRAATETDTQPGETREYFATTAGSETLTGYGCSYVREETDAELAARQALVDNEEGRKQDRTRARLEERVAQLEESLADAKANLDALTQAPAPVDKEKK